MKRSLNRQLSTIRAMRELILEYENYLEKMFWSRKIQWSLDQVRYDIVHMRKSVTLHKKWTISSVNVTTSTASYGFDNIYWRFLDGKLSLMGRMITFQKAGGAVRAITTLIEYLLHVICQIWFDEIYLLIDNIYTSDRHFHFYFPWWQNYGTVLKYFNMQSLATS